MTNLHNWEHEGYMAGIKGEDPDPELSKASKAYDHGWLIGNQDREAGVKPPAYPWGVILPDLRGKKVIIRRGVMTKRFGQDPKPALRTHKVTVVSVISGRVAYQPYVYNHKFERPTTAKVQWTSSGGLWCSANLEDVEIVEETTETTIGD